jgi:AraC-like DNA-binding protein
MEIKQEISKYEIVCHTRKFDKIVHILHWHDRYEFCQVLTNDLRVIIEGKEICASVGDIIAINERVVHQFIIDNDNTLVRICQLPMKLLLNFKSTVKPLKAHITVEEISGIPELSEKINKLFDMMEQEEKAGLVPNDPFLQSMASSVYFLLERYFSETYSIFSEERERQEFYQVIEYVNAHFKEDITVEAISKSLYISRGRLASSFKKYAGEGVSEYINKLRIKNANFMLSQGASITEASMESGFRSIRTFNNVYKGVMNMTPSEYIRKKK